MGYEWILVHYSASASASAYAAYALRSALRSARVCAWKPARMGATERLEPQSWQWLKCSRLTLSFVRLVLKLRHISHVTYSPIYFRSSDSIYCSISMDTWIHGCTGAGKGGR